jgi:hypothetical protein
LALQLFVTFRCLMRFRVTTPRQLIRIQLPISTAAGLLAKGLPFVLLCKRQEVAPSRRSRHFAYVGFRSKQTKDIWAAPASGGVAHRSGGIGGEDVAGDQPIEQQADGGEVLLDGRLRHSLLERLYIGATWSGSISTSVPMPAAPSQAKKSVTVR